MEQIKYQLSLDLGFKRLGYGSWADGKLESSGCLEWEGYEKGKEPFSLYRDKRLLYLSTYLDAILKNDNYEDVIIEQFPLNNLSTQRALTAMILAVVRVKADQHHSNWFEISAQEVKFFTTGDRKASKAKMRRKITELYPEILHPYWNTDRAGRKFTQVTFDEADAIAVGHTWMLKW